MTTIYLNDLGVLAPGLENWEQAKRLLRGETAYVDQALELKAPELLPAAERRRSSDSVRLALSVAEQVLSQEAATNTQPAAIFSSAYGDPVITHKLCELLSSTPPIASPILFHNSVHNAPAGYWSIATQNPSATTSIAAGDESFATSLLYAAAHVMSEKTDVLLISYDLPYPAPLSEKCPVTAPFATALHLSHQAADNYHAKLSLSLEKHSATTIADPSYESLRTGNPAARSLPLLIDIAKGGGKCHLPYLNEMMLSVEVEQ